MDSSEGCFFQSCPFFCYQVFVLAAFVVLKLAMNDHLVTFLDVRAGNS